MVLPRALLTAALLACGCHVPPPLDGRSAYAPDEKIEETWPRTARVVSVRSFAIIEGPGKLDPRVRGDSAYWAERFFKPAARPLEQADGGARISVYAREGSPDLVRYQYRGAGYELTLVESATYALLEVGGTGVAMADPAARPGLVSRVAEAVLNLEGAPTWRFPAVDSLVADARFSSQPTVDPAKMSGWTERADGGLAGDSIYFFLYKKSPRRVGYENAQNWFDDEFRKALGTFR